MIGREFFNARQIIVLVEAEDGSEHAFQVEMGTVRWEWVGIADGPSMGHGSEGRVTVQGRFYRKNRVAVADVPGLPPATKEIERHHEH